MGTSEPPLRIASLILLLGGDFDGSSLGMHEDKIVLEPAPAAHRRWIRVPAHRSYKEKPLQ
jgi:hypothetical protein